MRPDFTVEVHDFGPIEGGCLRLRPLTVLTGPNNAGKSYLAMLIYALTGSLGRAPAHFRRSPFLLRRLAHPEHPHSLSKDTTQWLKEEFKNRRDRKLQEFPDEVQKRVDEAAGRIVAGLGDAISDELERCFAAKLADLGRRNAKSGFRLRIEQDNPALGVALSSSGEKLQVKEKRWELAHVLFPGGELRGVMSEWALEAPDLFAAERLFESLLKTSYYFPAARSGILQGHKALASFILSRAPLVGIQRFEIPTLSGVLADFLANLLSLERRDTDSKPWSVAKFLEERACKGTVDLGPPQTRLEYPEIYYGLAGTRLPLHRTSSMVSEIAPIILFLKYLAHDDDLLIIEEPEAHLHPDNQRVLAQAMARLVRSGVRLLITTHSDYLLHQLSNFIMLGAAEKERAALGYSKDDYLRAEEVAAYLVSPGAAGHGSTVSELRVTEQDGIPEDEFVKIQEGLYDETTRIEYSRRG